MSNLNTIIQILQNNGKKITRLREVLADLLIKADSPLSPITILDRLARRGLRPHKTSVYRELDSLLEQDIIRQVIFDDGQPRYERMPDGHYHHIICLGCQKVDRVELSNDLDKEEKLIERKTRFKIKRHSLEFYGLCPSCRV